MSALKSKPSSKAGTRQEGSGMGHGSLSLRFPAELVMAEFENLNYFKSSWF